MRLMLAEKKSFKQVVKKTALIMTAPIWLFPKTVWINVWNNTPAAEKNRFAATLQEIKNSLSTAAGRNLFIAMNSENATYLLENLPALIYEANAKLAQTPTTRVGERRVISRYLKAFNQVIDEVYSWAAANVPPDGTPVIVTPPALDIQPPDVNDTPSFPNAAIEVKPWYKNPLYIGVAAVAAFLILPKLMKR